MFSTKSLFSSVKSNALNR
uniref:Uncharacterized protein n=1 Tax=Anguilla anguilla TaxID=7936 RepID=A0A0E9PNT2_ANGAN